MSSFGSNYQGMSAALLAAALGQIDSVRDERAAMAWVCRLAEATDIFRSALPGTPVAVAQEAFEAARIAHRDSGGLDRPVRWRRLQTAGLELARQLRLVDEARPTAVPDADGVLVEEGAIVTMHRGARRLTVVAIYSAEAVILHDRDGVESAATAGVLHVLVPGSVVLPEQDD